MVLLSSPSATSKNATCDVSRLVEAGGEHDTIGDVGRQTDRRHQRDSGGIDECELDAQVSLEVSVVDRVRDDLAEEPMVRRQMTTRRPRVYLVSELNSPVMVPI